VTGRPNRPRTAAILIGGALAVALGLRLWLAWSAPSGTDLESYRIVVGLVRDRAPLYESTTRYNYPPVWAWTLAALDGAARATGFSFAGVVRTFLNGVDVVSAVLLYRLARAAGARRAAATAALFLANPVGIWVTSVQGQFDGVSLVFLLAAILATSGARRGGGATQVALLPAALLSVSVAVKQVTALHPVLWWRRKGFWLGLLPYGAVLALWLPFAGQWRSILSNVLLYRSVPQSYGFSEFVLFDARFGPPIAALALLAGLAAAWALRGSDRARASLFVFLVLLFFAPGIGPQYLVWPITLGALFPSAGYLACTLAGALWIVGSALELPGSGQFFGHVVWLSVAFWGVREWRELRQTESPGQAAVPAGAPAPTL
jgi:hypothetical protein